MLQESLKDPLARYKLQKELEKALKEEIEVSIEGDTVSISLAPETQEVFEELAEGKTLEEYFTFLVNDALNPRG